MTFDENYFISLMKGRSNKSKEFRRARLSAAMCKLLAVDKNAYFYTQIDYDIYLDVGMERHSYFNMGTFYNVVQATISLDSGEFSTPIYAGAVAPGYRLYYAGQDATGTYHFRHPDWLGWSR